jgi:16S rRNA (guanine527-N7)-methyltransferase
MNTISPAKISESLGLYGVPVNEQIIENIGTYTSILLQWNERISLTTVVDPAEIVRFHFGESLFACSVLPIANGRLADVGSGAGFPGVPLALANPGLKVTLIESNAKKAAFLSEVVRRLKITNVDVTRKRMEDMPPSPGCFDFVTARALGQFDELLSWSRETLTETGKLILWLGESDVTKISSLGDWEWLPPVQIPGSLRRFLLVGSPKP